MLRVLIHGGFWRAAYALSLMRDLAEDLAGCGSTTWNLEYRRLGDGGGWPETLEDATVGIDRLAGVLGRTPGAVPERYAAASPRERLPLRARTLLTHGARDDDVPIRMSREFRDASGADLHVDAAAGHMEHLDPRSGLWEAVRAWL